MTRPVRVLFCGETFPAARPLLQARLPHDAILACPVDRVPEALDGVDVLIPLMARIDASLMDSGRFRLIQQWGAGIEGVDLAAAAARGIWVANVPSAHTGNADSVAEHAVLLMLALLRQLPAAQVAVRAGLLGTPMGRSLDGRTVCLFGLGAIARALARRLQGWDVRLLGIGRQSTPPAEPPLAGYFPFAKRHAAFAATDILVLCLPVTPETRGVIDAAALAALPRGAYLVNVARGPLVDYAALRAALEQGHLGGAALDVFWQEPMPPDDPLLALPNVVATPHVAGVTERSYQGIAETVATNIERLRRGEPPLYRLA